MLSGCGTALSVLSSSQEGVGCTGCLGLGYRGVGIKTTLQSKTKSQSQQLGCLNAERENDNHIKGPEDINIYNKSSHSCFSFSDELTVFIFLCKSCNVAINEEHVPLAREESRAG